MIGALWVKGVGLGRQKISSRLTAYKKLIKIHDEKKISKTQKNRKVFTNNCSNRYREDITSFKTWCGHVGSELIQLVDQSGHRGYEYTKHSKKLVKHKKIENKSVTIVRIGIGKTLP